MTWPGLQRGCGNGKGGRDNNRHAMPYWLVGGEIRKEKNYKGKHIASKSWWV